MTWKDITTYSRYDKERKPSVWQLEPGVSGIRLVVVSDHRDYPGMWVCTAHPLYTERILSATNEQDAKAEAWEMLQAKVTKIYNSMVAIAAAGKE